MPFDDGEQAESNSIFLVESDVVDWPARKLPCSQSGFSTAFFLATTPTNLQRLGTDHMMTRGFATIATGNEHFYAIASNLLDSYRFHSGNPMPFAIVCDRENEYTKKFDDVVILDHPRCSYLDKLSLPLSAPYDETIFIDADSLAYCDLNAFWELFDGAADFSAFGLSFPLDYRNAWFKLENMGDYAHQVHFIPDFIGGVYFIRKSDRMKGFSDLCTSILDSYESLTFRQFEKPADEPIFALAMAISNFRPVDRSKIPICFYPHALSFDSNLASGEVHYVGKYENQFGEFPWAYLVHWGNRATLHNPYKLEVARLHHAMGESGSCALRFATARYVCLSLLKHGMKSLSERLGCNDFAKRVYSKWFYRGL